jgi:hypothetical protein
LVLVVVVAASLNHFHQDMFLIHVLAKHHWTSGPGATIWCESVCAADRFELGLHLALACAQVACRSSFCLDDALTCSLFLLACVRGCLSCVGFCRVCVLVCIVPLLFGRRRGYDRTRGRETTVNLAEIGNPGCGEDCFGEIRRSGRATQIGNHSAIFGGPICWLFSLPHGPLRMGQT